MRKTPGIIGALFFLIGVIWLYVHLLYWPGHGEGQNSYILFLGGALCAWLVGLAND